MSDFQKLLKSMDLNVCSYSGRGMYGKVCLGVEVDGDETIGRFVSAVFFEISYLLRNVEDNDDPELAKVGVHNLLDEASEAFNTFQKDKMGLGQIFYFPDVKYI